MGAVLSWTPRRKGLVYCSPACGRGCTHEDYQDAMSRAQVLCEILGQGWKIAVHENLDWHVRVRKGELEVSEIRSQGTTTGYFAGAKGRGILGRGETPQKAIKGMVRELQSEVQAAQAILDAVNEDLA